MARSAYSRMSCKVCGKEISAAGGGKQHYRMHVRKGEVVEVQSFFERVDFYTPQRLTLMLLGCVAEQRPDFQTMTATAAGAAMQEAVLSSALRNLWYQEYRAWKSLDHECRAALLEELWPQVQAAQAQRQTEGA